MRQARHFLAALLAVIGVIAAVPPASARANCPLQATRTGMAMHHQHRAPTPATGELPCAVCAAILPAQAPTGVRTLPAGSLTDAAIRPLSGIRPTLDPPPPRAA